MSKIRKALDYTRGAILHPRLLVYYVGKVLKYKSFGYSDELLYWKREMGDKSLDYAQDMQTEDICLAVKTIESDFGINGRRIECLEIGPGPRSRLTMGHDAGYFNLTAVDPLAEDFKEEFGGRNFLVTGRGEDIAKMYPPNVFHMVYASNSIDHGDDPPKAFEAIDKVLKPSGILIVCGDVKAGDCNHWLGLHQHNLWVENRDLLWQTKWMKEHDMSTTVVSHEKYLCLIEYTKTLSTDNEEVPWFFGMWKKT